MTRTTQVAPGSNLLQRALRLFSVVCAGWVLASGNAMAQEPSNGLQDIQISSLPDRGIELRLVMREAAPEPLSFTIDNPARIVLDIPDSALEMSKRRQQIDLGPLDTVLMAEAGGRTRAVLNLSTMVDYTTRVSGNTIFVKLSGGTGIASSSSFPSAQSGGTGGASAAPAYAGPRAIQNIDFRRTREGGGRIIVALTDPTTPVDIRQEGGRVVALFKDTDLPDELLRRLDVQDFATPVTTVDALRVNDDVRILINAEG
ncbi:MAG: AMIN domain-containing protein, partial [Pseudomonadota bacterium]